MGGILREQFFEMTRSSVASRKFHLRLQTIAMAEAAQIPLYPPFSKGRFRSGTLTPSFDELRTGFGKEGRGDFWGGAKGELCRELSGRDTASLGATSGSLTTFS
jgi:hypothetical protein